MIKVNGENLEGFEGKTVSELLSSLGFNTVYVAIEMNGEILKRDNYPTILLNSNDELEVVSFVGGG